MKLYKIYSRAIGLLFALSFLCVGCENEDILDINDLEISPSNPESVVIVEPDDGITSVNALTKAINENGDATYILRRDGVYYMEGKNVFKHNVVIKAENGSGKMPIIQPICDAQGALNADMIRLEGSATFENIYIIGKDAATGNLMQRLFRIDESNVRLKFDNCFIDHCRNFCIRTDNVNNKIYLNNSTIRNLALTSDPANGRLIDSRGNEQDSIVINNCYVYNNTAHIVRFDNVVTNYFGIKHSTFYNVGHHIQINYAIKVEIENNIFANVGWKSSAASDVFWQISIPKKDERAQDISMSVCNNNLFFSEEFVDFDTFSKSDFRAVKVKECVAVPKSKKLLQFTLDDGTGTDRTILSGIHAYYEPEELVGKTLIAITNLPPRKMMGIESCGMLLSAVNNLKDSEDEELHLLMVDNHIPAGAKLY